MQYDLGLKLAEYPSRIYITFLYYILFIHKLLSGAKFVVTRALRFFVLDKMLTKKRKVISLKTEAKFRNKKIEILKTE